MRFQLYAASSALTLLRPSHSFELRAAPFQLLTFISLAVDPSVGKLDDLLCFQPEGLSETPLYKVKCELAEAGLEIPLMVEERREEVLLGALGAPIVKAMFRLIFILTTVGYIAPFNCAVANFSSMR